MPEPTPAVMRAAEKCWERVWCAVEHGEFRDQVVLAFAEIIEAEMRQTELLRQAELVLEAIERILPYATPQGEWQNLTCHVPHLRSAIVQAGSTGKAVDAQQKADIGPSETAKLCDCKECRGNE